MREIKDKELQIAMEKALHGIANDLVNELVLVAPVDTGRLRNSIKAEIKNGEIIISLVDYGKYVEFGTVYQKPNPFIRTTLLNKLNKIIVRNLKRHMK